MKPTPSSPADEAADLERLLNARPDGGFFNRRFRLIAIVLLILIAVPILLSLLRREKTATGYKTEPAQIGNLVVKVSATGNLQPTNQVDVSSELSGIVEEVYVDDNDQVKQNQMLACLDLSKLKDAVAQSRASLAAAEARVLQARATATQARAELARFRQVFDLSGGKVPSATEMDSAEANLLRAEADEASALAGVTQARANLQSDETDLAKAVIRSPINGVVLSRSVEPGQTVAASFQAPVLFTLAEDLTKMELEVDVDEADVGQIQIGQQAVFTVDAWPGRQYAAVITRVGYGSKEADGVISYPAVLEVNNDDLSLRPGMTATAEITTLTRENVLLVPNAALRFTPAETTVAPKKKSGGLVGALMPRPPRQVMRAQTKTANGTPRVWALRDGQPAAIDVRIGFTNGRLTEIVGGELTAGTEVITEATGKSS